eukprot:UN11339
MVSPLCSIAFTISDAVDRDVPNFGKLRSLTRLGRSL